MNENSIIKGIFVCGSIKIKKGRGICLKKCRVSAGYGGVKHATYLNSQHNVPDLFFTDIDLGIIHQLIQLVHLGFTLSFEARRIIIDQIFESGNDRF